MNCMVCLLPLSVMAQARCMANILYNVKEYNALYSHFMQHNKSQVGLRYCTQNEPYSGQSSLGNVGKAAFTIIVVGGESCQNLHRTYLKNNV